MRVIRTETGYDVYRPDDPWASPIALSTQTVRLYAEISRHSTEAEDAAPVRWNYTAENPLNNMRGMRLSRAAADPSLLTDDPYHLAPSGGSETIAHPSPEELALPAQTTAALKDGARLYIDHAHPEYSSPETFGASDAALWDRAGEVITRCIMERAEAENMSLVLVKNNTDGKDAAHGTHEDYRVQRSIDFGDIVRGMTPFMTTRPVICGVGRVGLGQKSQIPGFQMSQRADFAENGVGLETTFDRPIINTRDEAHGNPAKHRRFHIIDGDGNLFDMSILPKLGTTLLVLWAIEQGIGLEWEAFGLDDPIQEAWSVSHHPELDYQIATAGGCSYNGAEFQQLCLDLILETFERLGTTPDGVDARVLEMRQSVLGRMRVGFFSVVAGIEWVGKHQLLARTRGQAGCEWSDPRLATVGLQWTDLRPEHSLAMRLAKAGRVTRLFTETQVEETAGTPPTNTYAYGRDLAVAQRKDLVKASWISLVLDPGVGDLIHHPITDAASSGEL